ncbi:MAG: hypothetical protein NC185_07135 [Ruminococcus sp.]|nr:hypothetical protein [Ruminococcus sp.]
MLRSYHTFILPFVWEGNNKNNSSMDSFVRLFLDNPNWECTDWHTEYSIPQREYDLTNDETLLCYKEYQYFHPYVRRAIYGFDSGIMTNFSFMPINVRNKAWYYITKTIHGETRNYKLMLNGIRLKIFNTGIAQFIMECENHGVDADGKPQTSFDDIKNINDYGRRISLPFISVDNPMSSICADRLSVEIPDVGVFSDDYAEYMKELKQEPMLANNISLTHMCDYIKSILGYGSKVSFTSKQTKDTNKCSIYPALDDRMFVACYVFDQESADAMTAIKDGKYAYQAKAELSKSLYEFVFTDPGKECTCQSEAMRAELLEEHIYKRWLDCGSVYSVANQSINCLTNYDNVNNLDSFLTQYIQMACLTLCQRATLIHFQREASILSSNIEKPGKSIDKNTIARLMNLQERFVAYQSQLSFNEATPQEQGIEIYGMLRNFMCIEQETESLSDRLESLEAAADTNLDYGFNKIALIFTFVSCFLAVFQNVFCLYGEDGFFSLDSTAVRIIISLTAIAILISFFGVLLLYRRRKK